MKPTKRGCGCCPKGVERKNRQIGAGPLLKEFLLESRGGWVCPISSARASRQGQDEVEGLGLGVWARKA